MGNFVQSHEDRTIKNKNTPSTLDCMCLRPSVDRQEGHDLLHFQTNKIKNRRKFALVPTNEWCIKKVHSIAKHEGIPKILKIKDRNETVCFDSHWTAGVDYHYEKEVSSRENGEVIEESDDISTEDDEEEGSPTDLQEASDDSESDSDDEWDNETFVDMPEMKVNKRSVTVFEESESYSESDEESDS